MEKLIWCIQTCGDCTFQQTFSLKLGWKVNT